MKRIISGSLVVLLAGCGEMNVPDLNNPSEESLTTSPTRTTLAAAATGLLIGARANYAEPNGYIAMLGILGRELYNLDAADTRFITEMLEGSELNPGSPAFGGNFWEFPYANVRNAHNVLRAVERVTNLTEAEREATRGFARTIQALDFLVVITTRDSQGAPIDVDRTLDQPLAPIVSKGEVLAHIAGLLDEGAASLAAGGTAFPFPLSSGFVGFDTPQTFRQFNRALRARVAIYQEDFQAADSALADSFLDPAKPLSLGVYHAYGTGSGDRVNGLNAPTLFVHPRIIADADPQAPPGVGIDRRVSCPAGSTSWPECRIIEVTPLVLRGLEGKYVFMQYRRGDTPAPIIRNEDLILLRAEARYGLGVAQGDAGLKTQAFADVNFIREQSGRVGPTAIDDANFKQELFKQRRYSLLFEGGHSWIDARRLGLLQQLPKDDPPSFPAHHIHEFFPIPLPEMDARQ
jgi:hypothetical protein